MILITFFMKTIDVFFKNLFLILKGDREKERGWLFTKRAVGPYNGHREICIKM